MGKIYTDEDGNQFAFNPTTGNYEPITADDAAAAVADGATEATLPADVSTPNVETTPAVDEAAPADTSAPASSEVTDAVGGADAPTESAGKHAAPEVAADSPKVTWRHELIKVLEQSIELVRAEIGE